MEMAACALLFFALFLFVIAILTLTGKLKRRYSSPASAKYDVKAIRRVDGISIIFTASCLVFNGVMQYFYPERYWVWVGISALLMLAGVVFYYIYVRVNRDKLKKKE